MTATTTDFGWCLGELRSLNLVPDDTVALMCVGSFARGWANRTSDYDFALITKQQWSPAGARAVGVPLVPATTHALDFEHGDRRWEVAYWTDEQVDQMLAKVSWDAYSSDSFSLKALIDPEELFLERISTGLALVGEEWQQRRRRELTDSAYRAFVTTRSISEADGKVEDVIGMLADGDVVSAVLAAQLAFNQTVDALMDSVGMYGTRSPKWRARRVRGAATEVLPFDLYWEITTMAGFDAQHPEQWVQRVVRLCKDLAMEVEI